MPMHTTFGDGFAECPHCGYRDPAPYEWGIDEGSSEDVDCDRCGKSMRVTVSIVYTYEATADVAEDAASERQSGGGR